MRTKLTIPLLLAIAVLLVLAPVALAQGPQGQTGSSNVARLALTSNCSMHPDAWGQVTYNLSGSTLYIVLDGHKLPTQGKYQLYYGNGQYVTARANDEGDLHITASVSGAGVPPNGRFELVHIHEDAGGASCNQPMGTTCVILVSTAHGFIYTP